MKIARNLLGILCIWFGMCCIGLILFYVVYHKTSSKESLFPVRCETISHCQWLKSDGEAVEVDLPCELPVEAGETVRLLFKIPDYVTDDMKVAIYNSKSMYIEVDGEERFAFDVEEADIPGGVVKTLTQFCSLKASDSGKTMIITRSSKEEYCGRFEPVLIGDSWSLVHKYYQSGVVRYVATLFLIIVSIVLILFNIVSHFTERKTEYGLSMAVGVLIGAFWLLVDSDYFEFVFNEYYIDGTLSYMLSALLPFPFIICVNQLQENRYIKVHLSLSLITFLNLGIVSVLHFGGIVEFSKSLVVMDIVIILEIVTAFGLLVYDLIKKRMNQYRILIYGFFITLALCVLEVVLLNIVEGREDGTFILLGLWVLLIAAAAQQFYDIKNAERERIRAVSANEAKSAFLAKMSHEIRTPINVILGMNEMILRDSKEDEIKEHAADAKRSAQNLLEIINEILDSAKIESGKMEIVPTKYKVCNLLVDLHNMCDLKAKEKKLTLNFDIDETIPSALFGDDIRIRQILVNLLSNAIKYTKEGSVSLVMTWRKQDEKAILCCAVKDTGIGIKEKDIHKLLSDYERIVEDKNRYEEGTGLGMSITISLLKLMNSELTIESEYGVGSSFSFELEQGIEDGSPLGDYKKNAHKEISAEKISKEDIPELDVLVVDDNALNRKVFRGLLRDTKVHIDDVESGKECLEIITKKKYDIIFLDHMMPEMDGMEVLKLLPTIEDSQCKDSEIVMFTANAISGAREAYLEAGADDMLVKPVRPQALNEYFARYVEKRK